MGSGERGAGVRPMRPDQSALLKRAAARLERDPYFLGYLLADYRALVHIDEAALAAELGCSREGLVRLALCRAPREGASFRTDLESAATHAGADLRRLTMIVRSAQTFAAFQSAGATALVAAARDRDSSSDDDGGQTVDSHRPA